MQYKLTFYATIINNKATYNFNSTFIDNNDNKTSIYVHIWMYLLFCTGWTDTVWWSLMFLSQLIWNYLWHEVQMVVFFCDFGCRQWHTMGISCTIGAPRKTLPFYVQRRATLLSRHLFWQYTDVRRPLCTMRSPCWHCSVDYGWYPRCSRVRMSTRIWIFSRSCSSSQSTSPSTKGGTECSSLAQQGNQRWQTSPAAPPGGLGHSPTFWHQSRISTTIRSRDMAK